jgi:hypothetical protein
MASNLTKIINYIVRKHVSLECIKTCELLYMLQLSVHDLFMVGALAQPYFLFKPSDM